MAKWFWAGALSIVVVASLVAPTRWRTPLAALAAACALALAWRPRTKAAVQQERYPKQYVARRGTVAPIDGDLEKAVWRLAPWSEPFSEIRGPDAPKGTQPRPEEATRVKMLWDDEYLYIAAVMDVDAGNELVALFKERNSPIFHTDSDFEVFLDPAGCCHGYKELEINALNTVWNLLLDRPYSDGGGEYSGRIAQKGEPRWWDVEKQKTAVKVTKGQIGFAPSKAQWCVEVALRHSESLSQAPQRGAEPSVGSFWRINFSRVEKQGNVNWVWSPQVVWSPAERRYVGQVNMHLPDAWGYVVFADEAGKLHDGSSGEDFRDPGFPARHTAACLYYACRAFREATGRFPALQELRARQMLPDLRDATVQLRSRTDGYVAEVRVGGQEMRAASIECEGFLYATIDFTPPSTICSASAEVPRSYDGKRCTDDVVLVWNNLPNGWKQCPSDFSDTVREKVIKPYQWGTHLLVMEDGKAYRTPGCGSRDEPGGLQMIWEFEKGPGRMKLQRLGGSQSYWYGKLFIRAPVPN